MHEGRAFKKEEAIKIFNQQIEIIQLMRQKINP